MTKVFPVLSCVLPTNLLPRIAPRSLVHRQMAATTLIVGFLAALFAPAGIAFAQEAPLHLNPAVEKLAHG